MRVAFADPEDLDYLAEEDHHVGRDVIEEKIARREIVVGYREDRRIGFLRYGYFWDEIPFMNLLSVRGDSRAKGTVRVSSLFGRERCASWATPRS